MLQVCIQKVLGSNRGWIINYPEGFPQALQANNRILPHSDHAHILSNLLQFVSHAIIQCYSLNTESNIK